MPRSQMVHAFKHALDNNDFSSVFIQFWNVFLFLLSIVLEDLISYIKHKKLSRTLLTVMF